MWHYLKGCSPKDACLRFTFKSMKMFEVSRCCFMFTPRQGTLLVAIVELCLNSIMLFLLLLAEMNTQEIASITARELKDMESFLGSGSGKGFLQMYLANEERILNGQELALLTLTVVDLGVFFCCIHITSSLMLLYGTLKKKPNFLIPWLSSVLFTIIFVIVVLVCYVIYNPFKKSPLVTLIFIMTALAIETHAWFTVYSHHRELCKKINTVDAATITQTCITYEEKEVKKVDL